MVTLRVQQPKVGRVGLGQIRALLSWPELSLTLFWQWPLKKTITNLPHNEYWFSFLSNLSLETMYHEPREPTECPENVLPFNHYPSPPLAMHTNIHMVKRNFLALKSEVQFWSNWNLAFPCWRKPFWLYSTSEEPRNLWWRNPIFPSWAVKSRTHHRP